MSYICELHHELQKARQEEGAEEHEERFRAFTAAVSRHPDDIPTLVAKGWNTREIAQVYNVPLSFIQNALSRADRHIAARRRFMATGKMPEYYEPGVPGAVFTIYQS